MARARYANGLATITEITRAAEKVLVEQGHAALSMRRVADESGMKLGNVTYYFPTKAALIRAMLDSIVESFREPNKLFDEMMPKGPERALARLMENWMRFNASRRASRIYVEIWSMANNDVNVSEIVDEYYREGRERIHRTLRVLNPRLSDAELDALALFAVATMEGVMVFVNEGTRDIGHLPKLTAYAVDAVLQQARPEGGA